MNQRAVLEHFPPHTHPLTLASDPDGLLDDAVRAALVERGFTVVQDADPVLLRCRVEEARPWTAAHPLIVVTAGPLEALPYDLWQRAHRVRLSLRDTFPRLSYPALKELAPAQRERLAAAPSPSRRLGREGTLDHLLRHAFDAPLRELRRPAGLLAWLAEHHRRDEALPPGVKAHLLDRLGEAEALKGWPLEELLEGRQAFTAFVRDRWREYVGREIGDRVDEPGAGYRIDFGADPGLQGLVPALIETGALEPVTVERPAALPAWARPALVGLEEGEAGRRREELVGTLESALEGLAPDARWSSWKEVARLWAELTALHYGAAEPPSTEEERVYAQLQAALDGRFTPWLRDHYAALATQIVPRPHHLYHVPHYLGYRHPVRRGERVVLLVVDGLALADWYCVGEAWRSRHPDWKIAEECLLAQVPTLTSISRQALVSGLRPQEFAETLDEARAEARRWPAFWRARGLAPSACPYAHLRLDREGTPAELLGSRALRPCAVESGIDALIHEAGMGSRHFFASLEIWLDGLGRELERLIDELLAMGHTVYLTSDHGHTEAVGVGAPSEGILSQTRSKRARLYDDQGLAEGAHAKADGTLLWKPQGLLPEGVYALVALGRRAFTTQGKTVVSHGGISLDEVVVPFVTIKR
jgi:hypothetical protein